MDLDEVIRHILQTYRHIAVVGMSRDPSKAAYGVPAFLMRQGYVIYPVNPHAGEILGRRAYARILDIADPVEVVQIFRPSDQVLPFVEEAVQRSQTRGDVRAVWLQEGIRNEAARALAEAAGLLFVQDRCMLQEWLRLRPPNSSRYGGVS
ncbi:hypothetical protein HRbin11_00224 [bacterium HR11]|nr:hypothetical protein HRbin11_00224 [bacterium HR11]